MFAFVSLSSKHTFGHLHCITFYVCTFYTTMRDISVMQTYICLFLEARKKFGDSISYMVIKTTETTN